jgi:hypothetical protein
MRTSLAAVTALWVVLPVAPSMVAPDLPVGSSIMVTSINPHFVNDRHFNNGRVFVHNRFFIAGGPWW